MRVGAVAAMWRPARLCCTARRFRRRPRRGRFVCFTIKLAHSSTLVCAGAGAGPLVIISLTRIITCFFMNSFYESKINVPVTARISHAIQAEFSGAGGFAKCTPKTVCGGDKFLMHFLQILLV
jgi:hypothetical protein